MKVVTVISFLTLISLLVTGCGIRPVERPENNIPGWVSTAEKMTEAPESVTSPDSVPPPETEPPIEYFHEYDPNLHHGYEYTYLVDEDYIAEHTLGYCYIQNKAFPDLYVTTAWKIDYNEEFGGLILDSFEHAIKFCVLELNRGCYGLVTCGPVFADNHREAVCLFRGRRTLDHGHVNSIDGQHLIITKTSSGNYWITSMRNEQQVLGQVGGVCLSADWFRPEPGQEGIEPFVTTYNEKPYQDDDDYSDEWIFVPAEPPEGAVGGT